MDTNKLLATLCTGLMLVGCGDWNQNPLDGKTGNFGQGKKVPTKPDLSKPLETDSVIIELPSAFQSVEEGKLVEFPITARVVVEGYTADVSIENLVDFPGATFDGSTGMFRWTPPIGFIDSTGEKGVRVERKLVIRAFGHKPDQQVLFNDANCLIWVARDFKEPEILSINPPAPWLREGGTMLIPVDVMDKDAIATDRTTWPKLLLHSVGGTKSLAGLTTFYRDESLGGNRYRIFLQVDLREVEVSDSIDTFRVGLTASSQYGKISPARDMLLDIYTSFTTPSTTWTDVIPVKATETLTHKFLISDPKLEAWLSLDRTFNLPVGSTLNCMPTGRGLLSCTFTWTPAEGETGVREISAYIKSRNHDGRDSVQLTKTLYFRTQVLPKGS